MSSRGRLVLASALVIAPFIALAVLLTACLALWRWVAVEAAVVLAVVTLAGLLRAAWVAAHFDPPPPDGVLVAPADQPDLWQEVRECAVLAGVEPPTSLFVTTDVEAAVWVEDGQRRMLLGLPLVAALDRSELRSVVLHEMGHLRELTDSRALRILARLDMTAESAGGPALVALLPMMLFLDGVHERLVRPGERSSDLLAARLVGTDATADALRHTAEAAIAWEKLDADSGIFLASGVRPDLAEGVRQLAAHLDDDERRELERLMTSPSPSGDPHDPPAQRIAAILASGADTEPARDTRPAIGLLRERRALEDRLGPTAMRHLPEGTWEQTADGRARLLADMARSMTTYAHRTLDAPAPTLAALLDLAEHDPDRFEGEFGGNPFDDEDSAGAAPGSTTPLVDVASVALVEQAGCRFVFDWTRDRLVDAHGAAVPMPPASRPTADMARELRSLLLACGVDLDVQPGASLPPMPDVVVCGASALKARGLGHVDLLVSTAGLALVPTTGGLAALRTGAQGALQRAERMSALVRSSVDEVRAMPGVTWVPLDQVVAWRMLLRDPGGLGLRLADGRRLVLGETGDTEGLDEVAMVLGTELGPMAGWREWRRHS